jgi:aspartate beta-hydroxylase
VLYDRFTWCLRWVFDRELRDPPILDAARRFPDHRSFVAAWPYLREEALALARDLGAVPRFHELMSAQSDISVGDQRDWRMFVVKAYGVPLRQNLAHCPRLSELIAKSPDVLSATFSFLAPYKHIPEHRGPFRGILRFYLGLSVPCTAEGLPATELVIDGTSHRIPEGDYLLWDDTFPHEVRHCSPLPRIALLLDIRRRDLPFALAWLSRLLIFAAGCLVRLRRLIPGDPLSRDVERR